MAAVTITLSDEQLLRAKAMADKEGFAGIEPYLQTLLTERLLDEGEIEDSEPPQHLHASSVEQLRARIREGLDSPAAEMSQIDFDEMRRELMTAGSTTAGGVR